MGGECIGTEVLQASLMMVMYVQMCILPSILSGTPLASYFSSCSFSQSHLQVEGA